MGAAVELLPCPFCGVRPRMSRTFRTVAVECSVCWTIGPVAHYDDDESLIRAQQNAALAWNTRVFVGDKNQSSDIGASVQADPPSETDARDASMPGGPEKPPGE